VIRVAAQVFKHHAQVTEFASPEFALAIKDGKATIAQLIERQTHR